MEDMASIWSYQESVDEMRQKLLCTTLEFEQFKAETGEELRKRNEYARQLIQLLKVVCQERDEARDQLQKLFNKVHLPSPNPSEFFPPLLPQLQSEGGAAALLKAPARANNSSITESNSLSETYNYNSHGSPPVDSFFDVVSSPELSNMNMADSSSIAFVNQQQQSLLQDCSGKVSSNNVVSMEMQQPKIDHASLIIDNLIKGKPLPQKGKLLQAVLDAPPLLHSLLLAGPLPKWRNPPMLQPFQIPPFSIKTSDAEGLVPQKSVMNSSYGTPKSPNPQNPVQMSCGTSQLLSGPMFTIAPSGSCLGAAKLVPAGANLSNSVSLSKRQRLF